jgi:hypothetical protein
MRLGNLTSPWMMRARDAGQPADLACRLVIGRRALHGFILCRAFFNLPRAGRPPYKEQDCGEIADLQQNRADHGLKERRPKRLRNHISGDRKHQKHADKAAEEQQKGHFYPAVPLTRVRASKVMRKFLLFGGPLNAKSPGA